MEVLGLIPARGGSKGIPRKNIAMMAGKPLIAWTIEAARSSRSITRVVVTTDDVHIAATARAWGAEVPFIRPAKLARDNTPGMLPVMHAIRWMDKHENYHPSFVMVLQPTSPLRASEDIDGAFDVAKKNHADAVVSVSSVRQHPFLMKAMDARGRLHPFIESARDCATRQKLPKVFALNGAIYLARRTVLVTKETFYTNKTFGYVMAQEKSIDVDTKFDFRVAESLLEKQRL